MKKLLLLFAMLFLVMFSTSILCKKNCYYRQSYYFGKTRRYLLYA